MTSLRPSVHIVTDSQACIPPAMLRQYGIRVVPYQLIWDGQVYLDGQDISPTEFYQRFRSSTTYPTTATFTLGSLIEVFQQAAEDAQAVVGIFVAGTLSSAVSMAQRAAREISTPVYVVDSQTAASAQAFMVLHAARVAAQGATAEEVIAAAENCRSRTGMFFTFETLEHMHRGGRLGQAATLLGARLNIQPVLTLTNGQVRPIAVTRTRHRAIDRILQEARNAVGDRPTRAAVFHADVLDEANELAARVQSELNCVEFFISEFTPVMGAHTGPGVLGIGYCLEEEAR